MCSAGDDAALPAPGFPIRESAGQRLFSASPRLIAAVHALLRLLVPRHPPRALTILTVIEPKIGSVIPVVDMRSREARPPWLLCSFQGSPEAYARRAVGRPPRQARWAPRRAPVSQSSTACRPQAPRLKKAARSPASWPARLGRRARPGGRIEPARYGWAGSAGAPLWRSLERR